jgi:RTX calcium-binding nonapeptide repeat (4 copies)
MTKQRSKNTNRKLNQPLNLEHLEKREMFAVVSTPWFDGTKLIVAANDSPTTVHVSKLSDTIKIRDLSTSSTKTWDFASSKVGSVEFRGGARNDEFINYVKTLPIRAFGNAGNDYLEGYDANDYFDGGSGSDTIKGYGGNDTIFGGSDSDKLYGGDGNDRLMGGGGTDYLYGGAGNDGLIGGDLSDLDYLYGESGADRFLVQSNDQVKDSSTQDATIAFRNGSSNWTERELEVVDQAFSEMQNATGNTRLLKDTTSSKNLIFQKENRSVDYAGLNSTTEVSEKYWDYYRFTWKTRYLRTDRLIQIRDFNETNNSEKLNAMDTVIHEIGHNWDSSAERSGRGVAGSTWDSFIGISNWRTSSTNNHFRSGDGSWYYSKASKDGFFGDVLPTGRGTSLKYGKWNPREDWATTLEEYFKIRRESGPFGISGGIAGSGRDAYAQAKLDSAGDFLARVRNLG